MANLPLIEQIETSKRAAFQAKIMDCSAFLRISPEWLITIIHLESAFNPRAQNGSCVGLLQFCTATQQELGVTRSQIISMDIIAQMDLVQKYFKSRINQFGQPKTFVDMYLMVLYPNAANKYEFTEPLPFSEAAKQNNSTFIDENGNITKQSIFNIFLKRYPYLSNEISTFENTTFGVIQKNKKTIAITILLIILLVFALTYKKIVYLFKQ